MSAPILPPESLAQHVAVLGKTGSGKSYAAKHFVEGILAHKGHVCIGKPGLHRCRQLVDALVKAKLVDREGTSHATCRIHDWTEHCQDSVHKALARAGRRFADGSVPKLYLLTSEERAAAKARYESPLTAAASDRVNGTPRHTPTLAPPDTPPARPPDTPSGETGISPDDRQTSENVPSQAAAKPSHTQPSHTAATPTREGPYLPRTPAETEKAAAMVTRLREHRGGGLDPNSGIGSAATAAARPEHPQIFAALRAFWPDTPKTADDLALHPNATIERVLWLVMRAGREKFRKGPAGFIRDGIEQGYTVPHAWLNEQHARLHRLKSGGSA